jgi:hypothetical protein
MTKENVDVQLKQMDLFFRSDLCAGCDSVGDSMGQGDLCKFAESP